jgi:hypothetical protein
VDEFDLLYYAKDESVVDDVLNVLRGIKQTKETSSLHSFVGIGPFSILELTGKSASPFNIRHALRSPNFEEKDVVELFAQVKEDYGEIFDDRIPIDIFERTSGHRGLTGFCGKFLHEFLWKGKGVVTYEEWICSASRLLLDRLPKWPTMQKLVETLQKPISEKPRTLLLTHFLPSNSPVKVTPQEDKMARFLTAEGALINTEDDRVYALPSPLVRNFLLHELIQGFPLRNVPKEPIPFRNEGTELNIVEMVKISLKYFDRDALFEASGYSFKGARTSGIKRDSPVPQEGAYHVLLYSILEKWIQLPLRQAARKISLWSFANVPDIHLLNEKSSRAKRCDFLLDLNNGNRYVLEIMASDSNGEVLHHLQKTKVYSKAFNAQESWVIHFVATIEFDVSKLVWPEKGEGNDVNMMYIFHDLNWAEAVLVTRTTVEIQQTKIKLE